MDFTFFLLLVSFVVDVLAVRRKSPVDKDLEILALRHQGCFPQEQWISPRSLCCFSRHNVVKMN